MEIEILPFKIQGAQSKWNSPCLKSRGHHGKKKFDQNMLKNIIDISLFNFFALIIMIHKYYYLFTRPSIIVVCWKSIFSSLFNFSGANNLDHFLIGGIGGRNFMLVRGENLPMKYPWREPRGTSWKCVPPWGRKRAEPAKFCFEVKYCLRAWFQVIFCWFSMLEIFRCI